MLFVLRAVTLFQSTPSARRATPVCHRKIAVRLISIHALREEGDRLMLFVLRAVTLFQSTPSARRATKHQLSKSGHRHISIHALREEGDSKSSEKIHHFCSIIHACAQFEKELYKGSGKMQNKSC